MKLLKPGMAVAAVAIVLNMQAQAQNVADGTYTFTANVAATQAADIAFNTLYNVSYPIPTADEINALNGSWLQFSGDQIVAWDLTDPDGASADAWAAIYYDDPTYTQFFPPLTKANSSVDDLITYPSGNGTGPDAFSFRIGSPINSDGAIWFFEGANNLNGGDGTSSDLYDGSPDGPPPSDPLGSWTHSAPVPDEAGAFQLLCGALTVMGAFQSILRNRPARR